MAYHRPIPAEKQRGKDSGGGGNLIGAWVQAEKMTQIALMLPSAAFVGWLMGYGLDHWLHQTWISMTGIVVGILSGLVGAIKMALVSGADPGPGGRNGDGAGSGDPQ